MNRGHLWMSLTTMALLAAGCVEWAGDDAPMDDDASSGTMSLTDGPKAPTSGSNASVGNALGLPGPVPCGLSATEWHHMSAAASAADSSMHELVVCGGAQMRLAQTLMASVLLGSRDAFDMTDETYNELSDLMLGFGAALPDTYPQAADGGWQVMQDGSTGLGFTIYFVDPAAATTAGRGDADPGEVIQANPFKLESYLLRPKVTSTLTFDQMIKDMQGKNTYTFTFDGLGPLGHLLGGGEAVTSPFSISLSLKDFLYLAMGNGEGMSAFFGPIGGLSDVEMRSHIVLDDWQREVSYEMTGQQAPLATMATGNLVGFALQNLSARDGDVVLRGATDGLAVVPSGVAGVLRLQSRAGVELRADFRAGTTYPAWSVICADAAR